MKAEEIDIMVQMLGGNNKVARHIGVANSTVSTWRTGLYKPREDYLEKLIALWKRTFKECSHCSKKLETPKVEFENNYFCNEDHFKEWIRQKTILHY